MKPTLLPKTALSLIVGILVSCTSSLQAATRAKANNSDNLNLISSWTNNLAPGTADVALFDSTVTTPITVALGGDLIWNQINFINPGGDVTISAGNMLTLSNNTPLTFGAGTANLTLDCDLFCAGAGFATLPAAPTNRTVTYGGAIQGRNATVTLGNNTGTLRLGSALSTRIGSIVQVTTSGLKLGIGASSVGNPIASGPLGTNLFTWASTATSTELFAYNGDQTLANPVRIQSSPMTFAGVDDLTFASVLDLNNGTQIFNVTSNGVLRFTGVVSNATGLTKIGSGVLELGGTNISVWNNGLSIFGGTVRLLTNNVIPDGGSAGTLRMTNTTELLDLNGFSDVIRGVAGSGGSGNWNGTLDNTAPNTTSVLTLGDSFQYTVAGNIQNSGLNAKLALVKVGTGGLVLTNARTFSGGITNTTASQIFINSPGAAGTGPITLAHTNSELTFSGSGSITWTNNIILAANTQPNLNAIDGRAVEVASVISGPGQLWIRNTFAKLGAVTLSGDNTFTGGLVLYGGPVTLSHPRALGLGQFYLGDATVSGGSQNIIAGANLAGVNAITNAILINRDFTLGGTNAIEFAGPVVWITNSTQRSINVTNPAGIVISGPMSGYGFNKTGSGLLTFNGVCSHNGPSTVSTGPLALGPSGEFTGATTILVGSSASLDVSAVSGFAIKPTQALRANGGCKVTGHVTINGALTNNTTFGTATFSNNLTLALGSTTAITINRFSQPGTNLLCLGALTFGGNLIVNNFGDPLLAGDAFKLFGFTGNPGNFASLTLPPLDPDLAWNTGDLAVNGNISVVSTIAPPPHLSNPQLVNGTNFILTVTGGATNGQFRVLTQTNVAEPMPNWTAISTNTYDSAGTLVVTNPVNLTEPQRFFRIVQP